MNVIIHVKVKCIYISVPFMIFVYECCIKFIISFLADSSRLIEREAFSCFPDVDKLQYLRQLLQFLLDECK